MNNKQLSGITVVVVNLGLTLLTLWFPDLSYLVKGLVSAILIGVACLSIWARFDLAVVGVAYALMLLIAIFATWAEFYVARLIAFSFHQESALFPEFTFFRDMGTTAFRALESAVVYTVAVGIPLVVYNSRSPGNASPASAPDLVKDCRRWGTQGCVFQFLGYLMLLLVALAVSLGDQNQLVVLRMHIFQGVIGPMFFVTSPLVLATKDFLDGMRPGCLPGLLSLVLVLEVALVLVLTLLGNSQLMLFARAAANGVAWVKSRLSI
jgi:hypothetical protein